MSEIEALLSVQKLDNTIDQLRFRDESLPQRAKIVEIGEQLARLDQASATTEAQRDELRKRQRSLEADAGDLEEKALSLEAKLYDGSVTSPKEATALGEEIKGLRERRSSIEDDSIELLLEIEPLDEQLVQAEAARGELSASKATLEEELDQASADIHAELATAETKRSEAASALSNDVLEQYGKMRITYGPDAVVEFDPAHGGGCPVAMPAVELDRWKHLPTGTLEPCNDCGRLIGKLI